MEVREGVRRSSSFVPSSVYVNCQPGYKPQIRTLIPRVSRAWETNRLSLREKDIRINRLIEKEQMH